MIRFIAGILFVMFVLSLMKAGKDEEEHEDEGKRQRIEKREV